MIASGSDDASVRVWDIASATCVRLLARNGHSAAVTCLDIAPAGVTLASGGEDRQLLLWDLPSGQLRRRIAAHTSPLWCVGFSQEGAQLVTSSPDCTLGVWDASAAASANEAASASASAADAADADAEAADDDDAAVAAAAPLDGRFLLVRLHTKHTPVLAARYSRTNLLMAAGAFGPPAGASSA